MNDSDVQRILSALPRLAKAQTSVFGANGHGFQLNPPLPEEEVAAFEAAHSISLPSDYRTFITRVGNGGAGPAYGVFPLGETDSTDGFAPWSENDGFVGTLSQPFPHAAPWNDTTGMPDFDLAEVLGDEFDRQLDQFDERYWNSSQVNGAIPICHLGCALRFWLVLTGPEAGHVWRDERADYKGLAPLQQPGKDRLTFTAWYLAWLEECLAQPTTTPARSPTSPHTPHSS